MIKNYYAITKPGILYGNAITALAGFILASNNGINYQLMLAMLIGLSLVIASGCVFNNYLDRDIDAKMDRTKNRALVKGTIAPMNALVFGTFLGTSGLFVVGYFTTVTALIASGIGLFVYVVVYTMWLKRSSTHSALIGSIAGATPIVVGYTAVTGSVDFAVIILFFILCIWQMPHSFAIGIYRLDDYARAHIPILPIRRGIFMTKIQMALYTALFILVTLTLYASGYVGKAYFIIMALLGAVWLFISIKGFYVLPTEDKKWARSMFVFSIIILLVFCVMITLDRSSY